MPRTGKGRWAWGLAIFAATTLSYFLLASPETLAQHTPYNHFALLAEAWLNGKLALLGAPPSYTGNNDFAWFGGNWFVTFPPLPALILLPSVWLAGSAELVRDGRIFLCLSGLGPAILFLALEKLTTLGFGARGRAENAILALLFAWGSIYCFSAVQGTVWFAAHVVAVALGAAYLLFALGAERPFLAGVMLGLAFLTRTPLIFASPLLLVEAYRVSKDVGGTLAWRAFLLRVLWFAVPVLVCVGVSFWYNSARFHDPFNFGYGYLKIAAHARIERWGLFSYHYLPKNLGVLLTSLPYWNGLDASAPFQINGHGLALWLTTPLYVWLFFKQRYTSLHLSLWVSVIAVALPSLLYQNTGWVQFGYRFSNDYAVFLFALLALSGLRFGRSFWALSAFALVLNVFGAQTFGRAGYVRFYDLAPGRIYQAD